MVFPNPAFEQLWMNLCLELSTYFYVSHTVPDFAKNWAANIAKCLNVGSRQYPVYDYTRSDIIYIKLAQFLEVHMKTMFEQIHFLNGDLVVSQYVAYWSAFERRIPEILIIFGSLEEWITIQRDAGINVRNVKTLCYDIAKSRFFLLMEPKLSWTLRDMIVNEQYGEPLQTHLVSAIINTYILFGNGNAADPGEIYRTCFEAKLLTDFKKCFKNLRAKCLPHHGRDTCAATMSKQYRLQTNTTWLYLHPTTWPKIKLNFDEWQMDHNDTVQRAKEAAKKGAETVTVEATTSTASAESQTLGAEWSEKVCEIRL